MAAVCRARATGCFHPAGGALKPYLGYVVQWPVAGQSRFRVAYMDEGVSRTFRIEWFDRRQLVPVRIDPNWLTRRR